MQSLVITTAALFDIEVLFDPPTRIQGGTVGD
jgi:hypothetical protein